MPTSLRSSSVVKLTVSLLYSTVGTGVGVTVGKGVAVAVGGIGVAVGVDVSVGGMGVMVAVGVAVLTRVSVGGGEVIVGGMGVAAGEGGMVHPAITARLRIINLGKDLSCISISSQKSGYSV